MLNPCKNCSERQLGCHGKCEKYAAWKTERDKAKNAAEIDRIKMVPIKKR